MELNPRKVAYLVKIPLGEYLKNKDIQLSKAVAVLLEQIDSDE